MTVDPNQPHLGHPSVRIDNVTAQATNFPSGKSPSSRRRPTALSGWVKAGKIVKAEGQRDGEVGAGLGVIVSIRHDQLGFRTRRIGFTSRKISRRRTRPTFGSAPWLGHYGKAVTGTAWFSDLSLVELKPGTPTANTATTTTPTNPAPVAASELAGHLCPDSRRHPYRRLEVLGDGEVDGARWDRHHFHQGGRLLVEILLRRLHAESSNSRRTAWKPTPAFLRFPDPGSNYKMAGEKGCEIVIYGKKTGSIVFPGDTIRPSSPPPFLLGAWNEFRDQGHLGQRIHRHAKWAGRERDVRPRFARRLRRPTQTYKGDGPVQFRNVRIKTAPVASAAPAAPAKPRRHALGKCLWTSDVSLPAGNYDGTGKKIEVTKDSNT